MSTSTNWDELGISFSCIPVERSADVVDFMYKHFFPDEPCFRSLGFEERGWLVDKVVKSYLENETVKSGTSIMATDKEGKIIGLRLGEKLMKEKVLSDQQWMARIGSCLPFCLWSAWFGKMAHWLKVFDAIGYRVDLAFNKLGCDVIYGGVAVVVDKESRTRGLGTELVRRSMSLAETLGCEYMYLLASGEYSSKIFFKLNFTLDKECEYESITDFRTGEQLMTDTREHKKARVFYIKLNKEAGTDVSSESKSET